MKNNIFIYFKWLSSYLIVLCSMFLVVACETTPSQQSGTGQAKSLPQSPQPPPAQAENVSEIPTQPGDLWERIRLNLSWQTVENTRVDKAREALLRQNNYLPMIADRADYYLFYIVEEVQKRGMPMEIVLIPMVESTLDPFAASYSGAAGLWQIMPGTGKHMGLEQNSWYDGRQALRDSTEGALDHLQSMYEKFDEDWLLALAAYNAGGANISRAQRRNREKGLGTDYWSLNLPRQAYDYVPKIIALSQIVVDPAHFDVEIPPVDNAPSFEIADTGVPLHFAQAAQLAGVDVATLRALNPEHVRGSLSPHRSTDLLLPVGTRDRFEANVAQLSSEQRAQQLLATSEAATATGYQVRAGDSLYRIADRFKVSISNIIAWNALDPDEYLHPGQKLTLYVTGR